VTEHTPIAPPSPVLVMPGWLAGDTSTRALRWFLRDRGYHAHAWRLGRNRGPTPEAIAGMIARLQALHARHGRRVSLVGWSLGGIYARELARRFPDMVRQVITLASPFRDTNATTVARLYRSGLIRPPRTPDPDAEVQRRLRTPLAVPSSSLYSRTDGIVAWRSCLDDPGPTRENIAIRASHCGIGHHPAAMLVIADRLSQPEGTWRPYIPPLTDRLLGVSHS
jgi:pimeloyl-ACP methyl ester carboxylesterase